MTLVTRCPLCGTAFRAQAAQLAARGGQVRCGKCSAVFNGISALVEEREQEGAHEPSPQLALFEGGRGAQVWPEDQPLPDFLADEPEPRRTAWLWALLALAAAIALAAQIVYRYRAEIAAYLPAARAPLVAACRALRCEVPLPRRPELMSIDSSDLQADPRRESVIVLNAVLRNRASFAQEYPALELTLTDAADRPVLRRVLAPSDYLEGARVAQLTAQGVAPGADAALRVHLEVGRLRAIGYRLYLFYP